jgi:hypothetical protein
MPSDFSPVALEASRRKQVSGCQQRGIERRLRLILEQMVVSSEQQGQIHADNSKLHEPVFQQVHEFKQAKSSKPATTTWVANGFIADTSVQLSQGTLYVGTLAALWKDVSDQCSRWCLCSGKQHKTPPSPREREAQNVRFPVSVHAEGDAVNMLQVLVCDKFARCRPFLSILARSTGRFRAVAMVHSINDEYVFLPVVTVTRDLHLFHFGVNLAADEKRVLGRQV